MSSIAKFMCRFNTFWVQQLKFCIMVMWIRFTESPWCDVSYEMISMEFVDFRWFFWFSICIHWFRLVQFVWLRSPITRSAFIIWIYFPGFFFQQHIVFLLFSCWNFELLTVVIILLHSRNEKCVFQRNVSKLKKHVSVSLHHVKAHKIMHSHFRFHLI